MARLNEHDLENFRKVFQIFDKDNSGSINRQVTFLIINNEEISEVFKELNIKLSEHEVNRIMENFDASGDGQIQFEEFLEVIAAHFAEPESEEWMFEVFETMDQDGDGLLSRQELMKVAKLYNLEIEEKDVELMMELGDQHGEGGLSYEEFVRILRVYEQ